MRKAVFFDRDGTIILPSRKKWILEKEDFYIPFEYFVAVGSLVDCGFDLFVVTNQGGIALGYTTEEKVREMNDYIARLYEEYGGVKYKEIVYCPHYYEEGKEKSCGCRKPDNGMIEYLIEKYGVDRGRSWMVGDMDVDILAGKKSGLKTIKVLNGVEKSSGLADWEAKDLVEAIGIITREDKC